jgi:hypothetical protein
MLTAATGRGGELLCRVLCVTMLLRAADTAGASLPQQVSSALHRYRFSCYILLKIASVT